MATFYSISSQNCLLNIISESQSKQKLNQMPTQYV